MDPEASGFHDRIEGQWPIGIPDRNLRELWAKKCAVQCYLRKNTGIKSVVLESILTTYPNPWPSNRDFSRPQCEAEYLL